MARTERQSIYVLKDTLRAEGLGQVRRDGTLVRQVLTVHDGGRGRSMTVRPVDWASKAGWYVDLDPGGTSPGERVNVDMQVELGVLKAVGNVPSGAVCSQGGSAWLYALDLASGRALPGATTLAADSAGQIGSYADPDVPATAGKVRRVEWREVAD